MSAYCYRIWKSRAEALADALVAYHLNCRGCATLVALALLAQFTLGATGSEMAKTAPRAGEGFIGRAVAGSAGNSFETAPGMASLHACRASAVNPL
jgi:hypothetical protein